ncbi:MULTISPECIES: DUF5682 family protein [unclassified Leptolyngbya]|uniref:DUF5682 family protein n=1 Tax=unclassified Leptolyngbya TaxID=2650499 RepID=UPI001682EAD8|nr:MULTISPECIES: DUF5682 family protein [unclassified Leptolyngbya]MBD1909048.1 hypothetical protein [Leptolyngbya sp. FACHB-8]MBD2157429.1 hypothetical protein [Leptolyngbya sp. FACHB-16]
MSVHVFGIRHHGPGSARSLCQALTQLQPDMVLVEGPPDAEAVLPLLAHRQMRPPVALLIYAPDDLQQAVYYPFAVFSPEWQAIHYALTQQIPVRFMDLPQAHRFALRMKHQEQVDDIEEEKTESSNPPAQPPTVDHLLPNPYDDPLSLLAQAAGYSDGERWWEHLVEQRQDSTQLFTAIGEAMTALRSHIETHSQSPRSTPQSLLEPHREAYMRKTIREATKQGYQRIAVVCGAWHAPALETLPPAKEDAALLKGLPKVKTEATWIPWTHGRLAISSGYGAGIESPGWYQHLWDEGRRRQSAQGTTQSTTSSVIRWMAKVARLLRKQDLDASSASVIEAVRLAETLAALRDRPLPGLTEFNEATQTVLCFGDPLPMQLIHQQLIVGERLGKVPAETPMIPLQQDLQRQQKRLRLKPDAAQTTLDLDLRKPLDLERSHLFHRLTLLQIDWGQPQTTGNTKGTFRESWRLQWQPEFAIRLIEVGIWGNTLETAATGWTCDRANKANLPELTRLIDQTLLANLPQAIAHLMNRLEAEAALASDLAHLMNALPPLVNVLRYGTVRQFETTLVSHVVEGLITRVCIGLPIAVASLDDDAATQMYRQIVAVNGAIALLQQAHPLEQWQQVLLQLADQQGLHGLVAGRCCRLLFDAGVFQSEDAARRLGLALSTAIEPAQAAAWIEGFLTGSGLLLIHNPALWQVLDDWVTELSSDTFTAILPLLRRTFSTFAAPERRQMGERVRQGNSHTPAIAQSGRFDGDRADTVLPLLAQLLGIAP